MDFKWNSDIGYKKYVAAENNLKSFLGISQLDYYMDPERHLAPYLTSILEYLTDRLIMLGIDTEIKNKINEVVKIFEKGADKIIHEKTLDLVREIELTNRASVEGDSVKYSNDRFVFCWTNLMSTLVMRLKLQYAYLWKQENNNDCCKCGHGQSTKDFESWKSNVFPDDETEDWENHFRPNTAWGTGPDQLCGCYRTHDLSQNDCGCGKNK